MCGRQYRSSYRRSEARDPNLRASDADRERVVETLREHGGEGRLDPEELERRLERAYAAVTLGDLDEVVSDLPRRQPEYERARHRPHGWAWQPIVVLVAVVAAISVAAGHAVLWVAIPLFFILRKPYLRPYWRL